mgnify:CR=1 FL=1
MDALEAIKTRRSVRKYSGDTVAGEEVMEILEAARMAPSGLNNQPWRFKVLEADEKDAIASHTKYYRIILESNKCICVFLDKNECYSYVKDVQACGACIQNMLLAAFALGLGAVWLGEIINQKDEVNKTLGLGGEFELMGVVAVGHLFDGESIPDKSRKTLKKLLL